MARDSCCVDAQPEAMADLRSAPRTHSARARSSLSSTIRIRVIRCPPRNVRAVAARRGKKVIDAIIKLAEQAAKEPWELKLKDDGKGGAGFGHLAGTHPVDDHSGLRKRK